MATVPEIEALRRGILNDVHMAVQAKVWVEAYCVGWHEGLLVADDGADHERGLREQAYEALAKRSEASTVNLMRAIAALDRVEADLRILIEQTGPRFIHAG